MITAEGIEATWAILEDSILQSREIRVREVVEVKTPLGHPLFAIDANHHRHLLIPVKPRPDIREDKRSAGVQVAIHPLVDKGASQLFVDVICQKIHLNKLFSIILEEILNLLVEDEDVYPDLICGRVLNRWRELLERGPSGRPDMHILTGLFGELWQLREIVSFNPEAVKCWLGPTGARHDLAAGRIAIEVKASHERHGRFVTINGIDQLEPPPEGELYVATLKLEHVQSRGETIAEVVDSIIGRGGDQYLLFTLLSTLGITPDVIEACRDIQFRVLENRCYQVDAQFPRIVASSFNMDSLPVGVLTLTYQIDLSAEPPYPLNDRETQTVYARIASEIKP